MADFSWTFKLKQDLHTVDLDKSKVLAPNKGNGTLNGLCYGFDSQGFMGLNKYHGMVDLFCNEFYEILINATAKGDFQNKSREFSLTGEVSSPSPFPTNFFFDFVKQW